MFFPTIKGFKGCETWIKIFIQVNLRNRERRSQYGSRILVNCASIGFAYSCMLRRIINSLNIHSGEICVFRQFKRLSFLYLYYDERIRFTAILFLVCIGLISMNIMFVTVAIAKYIIPEILAFVFRLKKLKKAEIYNFAD